MYRCLVAALYAAVTVFLPLLCTSQVSAAERLCGLLSPDLGSICGAINSAPNTLSQPHALNTAIDVFADALVHVDANKSFPSSAELDRFVVAHLSQRARKYCDELADKMREPPGSAPAAVACLRPVCIDTSVKNRPPTCKALGDKWRSYEDVARALSVSVFGPCPQGASCIQVDEDAAELIVLVDQITNLIHELWTHGRLPECASGDERTCRGAILWVLNSFNEHWSVGRAISQALADSPTLASGIDPSRRFHDAWARTSKDASSAAAEGRFPYEYRLFASVESAKPLIEEVIALAQAKIQNALTGQIVDLWRRGQSIALLVDRTPALKEQAALAHFRSGWLTEVQAKLGHSPDPASVMALANTLIRLEPQIASAENTVRNRLADIAFGNNASQEPLCSAGTAKVNWEEGILDFCFPKVPSSGHLSGLRLVFAPCAPGVRPCASTGDLRLLVNPIASSGAAGDTISLPLGIQSMRVSVDEHSFILAPIPPEPAYKADPRALASAIARLLPSLVKIADVGHIDVSAGPSVKLTNITLSVPALNVGAIKATLAITEKGITLDSEPLNDRLRNAINSAISHDIRLSKIAFSNLRPLGHGDTCNGLTVSNTSVFLAFCGDIHVDLSPFGRIPNDALSALISVDNLGSISINAALDERKVAPVLSGIFAKAGLGKNISVEAISLNDGLLNVTVQGAGNCFNTLRFSLLGPGLQGWQVDAAKKALACSAVQHVGAALKRFNLFGLDFSDVRADRVCLHDEPAVCIVGPSVDNAGHVDFTNARLEDNGLLASKLRAHLNSLLPVGSAQLTAIEISGGTLRATMTVAIPYVDAPASLTLVAGKGQAAFADAGAFWYAPIKQQLIGKTLKLGSLQFVIKTAQISKQIVAFSGSLSFGSSLPVELTARIWPNIAISAPALNAVDLINAALNYYHGKGGDDKPRLVVGPDYLPVLQVPLAIVVPIGTPSPINVRATVEAKPGGPFRMAGPIAFDLPIWIPAFSGLDIGGLRGEYNPDDPGEIKLGASLALTHGEQSQNAIAFRGEISFQRGQKIITVQGTLDVLHTTLAYSKGTWATDRGRLQIDTGFSGVLGSLPLPRSQILVDASTCLLAGTASAKLLGVELTKVGGAFFAGPAICKASQSSFSDTAAQFRNCGNASGVGLICLIGSAAFGSIAKADARMTVPVDFRSPHLNANVSVLQVAQFSTDVNVARAALGTHVFGFTIKIILPTLLGVSGNDLKKILENILKPSFDLNALKNKTIVVAQSHAKSSDSEDDESTDTPASGSDSASPNGAQQTIQRNVVPAEGRGSVRSPILTPSAGDWKLDTAAVPDAAHALRLVFKRGNDTNRFWPDILLRPGDAGDLLKNKYYPIPFQPVARHIKSADRFVLMCAALPCDGNKLAAMPILASPDDVSPGHPPIILGDIGLSKYGSFPDGTAPASLANYLALEKLDNLPPTTIYCVPIGPRACEVALTMKAPGRWTAFWFYEEEIAPSSLVGRLLARCQPVCKDGLLKTIGTVIFKAVAAVSPSNQNPLSALIRPPPDHQGDLAYARFSDDSASILENRITLVSGKPIWRRAIDAIDSPLLSAALGKLNGMPGSKDRSWMIALHTLDGHSYIAGLSREKPGVDATMISGFDRPIRAPCVRTKPYQEVLATLERGWLLGRPGPYTGGISKALFQRIKTSANGEELVKILANPSTSDAGFSMSPLLLFGRPDAPAC